MLLMIEKRKCNACLLGNFVVWRHHLSFHFHKCSPSVPLQVHTNPETNVCGECLQTPDLLKTLPSKICQYCKAFSKQIPEAAPQFDVANTVRNPIMISARSFAKKLRKVREIILSVWDKTHQNKILMKNTFVYMKLKFEKAKEEAG